MPGQNDEVYRFGRFRLSPSRHALYLGDAEVPLAPKSFEVLLYLARNPGRLVTKDELLKAVWADAFIEEANLAQHIFRLRRAFETEPGAGNLICTMPGRGYQFTAEVSCGVLPPAVGKDGRGVVAEAVAEGDYGVERWRERTRMVVEEMAVPRQTLVAPAAGVSQTTLIAGAMLVALLVGVGAVVWRWHGRAVPSAYRQVVLADFVNATGDAAFDRTLKRALEIGLAQSPYMDVLSERAGVNTLQMMGRNSDTGMSPDIAREVCERTNREVLLAGTISTLGRKYLLTLEASDCVSAKRLASAKAEADSKEGVLEALDRLTEEIRKGLNESAKSLEDYQVPIREATTGSLEALKAYSTGKYIQSQGRSRMESIAAFQRAVELDPNFAMAYRELGVDNFNLSQGALAATYFKKAYQLSEHLSTYEQLYLRADYYAHGERNYIEGIKAFQVLSSVYPRDPVPVINVMDESTRLGQFGASVAAGERGAKLFPMIPLVFENLAEAYRGMGRLDDSVAAAEHAATIGKGDTGLHLALFDVAFARQDEAMLARETAWFDAHDDGATVWYLPAFRGASAAALGKYSEAKRLYRGEYQSAMRLNLPETSDEVLIDQAGSELGLGFVEEARATLRGVREPVDDHPEVVGVEIGLGDVTLAEKFLAAHSGPTPDTLMSYVYLPRVRAALALERGKPLEAIAALESARPYEMRDYAVPMLRAEAYRKAGQAGMAVKEYRKILDNPGVDPTSVLYPLAHLGEGRAYAMQHEDANSRREYEALFDRWKDGDADVPVLQRARAEYARLAR